jgi:predicted RecB family nuclease
MTSAVPEPGEETRDEAQARHGRQPVWLAPPQLPPWPVVWFRFEGDLEGGEPDRASFNWDLAVDDGDREPVTEIITRGHADEGGRRAWERFVARAGGILERHPHARWVHYSTREKDRMRHCAARHGAPSGFLERMEEVCFDLLARGVRRSVRLPLDSDSLREVAGYAGFRWSNPDPAPPGSAVLHRRFRASADPAEREWILQEIVDRNADDLLAMRTVWRWLQREGPKARCG